MEVTVVEYLAKKLDMIGIRHVFGLPGDYNFNILDGIIKSKNLEWINCTNELNAGYAADGYARINGFGAIVTTYGVGELSAINAIAGSYAENLPVIHIAGVPSTSFIKNNSVVHHNFANPDYYRFQKIYSNVTETTAYLTKENAKSEIDRIINVMVNSKKPIYVAIPIDVCNSYVEDFGYDKTDIEKSDEKSLVCAFKKIENLINSSENPIIFFDYLTKRYNLQKTVRRFIEKTDMKFSTFLMGKGTISETLENYAGINMGNFSDKTLLEEIKNSDLIITVGFLNADLNTGGFSAFEKEPDIKIEKSRTIIKDEIFEQVFIEDILNLMADKICKKYKHKKFKKQTNELNNAGKLTTKDIIPAIENILEKDDIFVMETGLMSIAGAFLNLKENNEYLSQTLWGSIGWATPAAFGAMVADKKRNLILFTGEGAHQLSVQETANFFEHNLCPIIFVLNNGGYTVERVLSKDPNDKFNDITSWDYSKLPEVFSNGKDYYSAKVKTLEDLNKALSEIKQNKGKKLCYIELFTDKDDMGELGSKLVENMKNYSKGLTL